MVLETPDGRPVGLEVKAAATVRSGDFQGLKSLQESFPKQFCRGVLLHFGEQVVPFGDKLWTVPLGRLWAA